MFMSQNVLYRGTMVTNKNISVKSIFDEDSSVEEFLTVGIKYTDVNGVQQGLNSYMGMMCENGIRYEFGLPSRERMDNVK